MDQLFTPSYNDSGKNFLIKWHIPNFQFCWHETGEKLESQKINLCFSDEVYTTWSLWLFPRGEDDADYISFYLFREKEEQGPETVNIDFEFSLLVGETVLKAPAYVFKMCSFGNNQKHGLKHFVHRQVVLDGKKYQMEPFVFCLQCTIFNRERDKAEEVEGHFFQSIRIERISGTEILDDDGDTDHDCNKDIEVGSLLEEKPLIHINVSYFEENLVIKIYPVDCKEIKFAICKITVIRNWGDEPPIEHCRSWIGEIKADIWRYHVLFPEIESAKPNCDNFIEKSFFLRYEFAFSTGVILLSTELDADIITQYDSLQQYFDGSKKTSMHAMTALDALEHSYVSQSFVDVNIQTESKVFPAHKALLCARCPKFMSEIGPNSKEVAFPNIRDIKSEEFFLFLYTDTVQSPSLMTTFELYQLSFSMDIELLKRTCRNFLRSNIDICFVCLILRLSGLYKDLDVRTDAENFLLTHYEFVLRSNNWKTVAEHYPELPKEIILMKYKKKNKIELTPTLPTNVTSNINK